MGLQVEHIFTAKIKVDKPIEIGDIGAGIRRVIPITGGTCQGPKMQGTILPSGADYQIVGHDRVTKLVAHYVIQTDDGVPIYIVNEGYRHGPKDVMDKLIRGEEVPDGSYYFKTTPTFETGSDKYAFLNKMIVIGEGIRRPDVVEVAFYQVL